MEQQAAAAVPAAPAAPPAEAEAAAGSSSNQQQQQAAATAASSSSRQKQQLLQQAEGQRPEWQQPEQQKQQQPQQPQQPPQLQQQLQQLQQRVDLESIASALAKIPQPSSAPTSTTPFVAAQLNFDASKYVYIEVSQDGKLYRVLTEYIANNLLPEDATSFSAEDKKSTSRIALHLGLGIFRFTWRDLLFRCIHQRTERQLRKGDMKVSLVIFAEKNDSNDAHHTLQCMCEELLQTSRLPALVSETETVPEVSVFKWLWHIEQWTEETRMLGRPISSVILPKDTETRLINDLDEFLSEGTWAFYQQHGIPLRRSYLLHGVPGAGKTSLIQAVATQYQRNLCYLVPSDPGMADESLRSAVSRVPENSIVVIEDIDALFTGSRQRESALMDSADSWGLGSSLVNAATASRVTLSGLLNALDGIGIASGQIVFLTTNHRDQLDPALIRPGRVDVHIEFKHATSEQMKKMWCRYYPKDKRLGAKFAEIVQDTLGEEQIVTAYLQSFFIEMRRKTGPEALQCVQQELARQMDERKQRSEANIKQEPTSVFQMLFSFLSSAQWCTPAPARIL